MNGKVIMDFCRDGFARLWGEPDRSGLPSWAKARTVEQSPEGITYIGPTWGAGGFFVTPQYEDMMLVDETERLADDPTIGVLQVVQANGGPACWYTTPREA